MDVNLLSDDKASDYVYAITSMRRKVRRL